MSMTPSPIKDLPPPLSGIFFGAWCYKCDDKEFQLDFKLDIICVYLKSLLQANIYRFEFITVPCRAYFVFVCHILSWR